jgi:hypothetical protein
MLRKFPARQSFFDDGGGIICPPEGTLKQRVEMIEAVSFADV